MTTHPILSTGATQCEQILARLELSPGGWVAMPELARLSGAYAVHSRVSDLRRNGHAIEHRNERHGRRCLSFYRLPAQH